MFGRDSVLALCSAIDFTPGDLLGCVSGELGLRKFLEARGHELVVTCDEVGCDTASNKPLHLYVMS